MIKTLIYIISFLAIFFLDSFLFSLFSFSLLSIFLIYFWYRNNSLWYFSFVFLLSFAMDTVFHLPLGTHLIFSGVVIFLGYIFQTFIPLDKGLVRYVPLFLITLFSYFSNLIVKSFVLDSVFPSISWSFVLSSVIFSLISLGIYIVLDSLTQSFRGKEYERIRLR